jgi:sulfide:quinone oxidoreductase
VRVLIAGAGVAAFELALGLRDIAAERVSLEFLAPDREFRYRPLAVVEPFGLGRAPRYALSGLLAGCAAHHHPGRLDAVDLANQRARTASGAWIDYDVLAVAVGARPRPAVHDAISYAGWHDALTHRRLLDRLTQLGEGKLVFAVPAGPSWPLPLYELALLTAAELHANALTGIKLELVTPEPAPLSLFGTEASETVAALLADRGIELISGETITSIDGTRVLLRSGGEIEATRVVALTRLEGPAIAGLPADRDGFIPTDPHGHVHGTESVFAAGDVTSFPIKHGGLASQQADAAAETIAQLAGVHLTPRPFSPVVHGLVLTGEAPIFLRVALAGGQGDTSEASSDQLWWPPSKIVGRYLAPYLALHHDLQLD